MSTQFLHMIFSPQNSPLELLAATLTSDRKVVANSLLQSVKRGVEKKASHHHLLIGPRGAGKTHVLAFVRKTIEQAPGTFPHVMVLALSEEERGLTSLLDFLLACLRAARIDLAALFQEIGGLSRPEAEQQVIRRMEALASDKSVLVVMENLSNLFAALEDNELSRLRGFLQTHPNVSLMASSTELFLDSARADHPFYGFFEITPLRSLKRKETGCYLANLAETRGDHALAAALRKRTTRPRLNAIYDLTGGNHRLLAMLSSFLTLKGLADLVGPFVQTVDRELTPYYQQRLDRLSPQQNKILRTIADQHGRALPVKEISALIFSDSQTVSRQLHDLLHGGLVRRTARGRESCYELNEPLMRLVLDIKEGRSRPLPLIVSFLTKWHDVGQLKALAEKASPIAAAYYRQARTQVEDQFAKELFDKGLQLGALGRSEEAIAVYDDVAARFAASERPELQGSVARALLSKGITLIDLGRNEEAVIAVDEVVSRFGANEQPELQGLVAKALICKSFALIELGCSEEAIVVCNEMVSRFSGSEQPELQEFVAWILISKILATTKLGRNEDVIVICNEVVNRFSASKQPELQKAVARALVSKGLAFIKLGRDEEAVIAFDEVITRFGASEQPGLQEGVARALNTKGPALINLGRYKDAIVVCDEVVKHSAASKQLKMQESTAKALIIKVLALIELGRSEEAIVVCDEVVSRFGASEEPEFQEAVVGALSNKVLALTELGRSEEAIVICDEVVSRFGTSEQPDLQESVAWALFSKAFAFIELGRSEEAIRICDEMMSRFGASEQLKLQGFVAKALVSKGLAYLELGRSEEAILVFDEVVTRFGVSEHPELREVVSVAFVSKAENQFKANKPVEALQTCNVSLSMLGQDANICALKAEILLKLGSISEALAFLESSLSWFPPTHESWPETIAQILPLVGDKAQILGQILSLFHNHPSQIAQGMITWLRDLLPLDSRKAQALETTEMAMQSAWVGVSELALPLQALNAVRRDAKGDEKALLELPLEIRNLIRRADDSINGTTES